MDKRYKIQVWGELMAGWTREDATQAIAALFKRPPEAIAPLFSGRTLVIKSGLDQAAAQRYQEAIQQAGLRCRVVESEALALVPVAQQESREIQSSDQTSAPVSATSALPERHRDDEAIRLRPTDRVPASRQPSPWGRFTRLLILLVLVGLAIGYGITRYRQPPVVDAPPAALASLLQELHDEKTRGAAIKSLIALGAGAERPMLELLDDPRQSWTIRSAAATVLAEVGAQASIAPLLMSIHRADEERSRAVIKTLHDLRQGMVLFSNVEDIFQFRTKLDAVGITQTDFIEAARSALHRIGERQQWTAGRLEDFPLEDLPKELLEAVIDDDAARLGALLAGLTDHATPMINLPYYNGDGLQALMGTLAAEARRHLAVFINDQGDFRAAGGVRLNVNEILTLEMMRAFPTLRFDADGMPSLLLRPDTSLLMAAVHHDRPSVIPILVQAGAHVHPADTDHSPPLLEAAAQGKVAVTKALLAAGADPVASSHTGPSPLMLAAKNGHIPVLEAMLAAGADLDARGGNGSTALLTALDAGRTRVVNFLLDQGADPRQLNESGKSLLALALRAPKPDHALARRLLAAGADPNGPSVDGSPLLFYAIRHRLLEAIPPLLEAGANIEHRITLTLDPQEGPIEVTPLLYAVIQRVPGAVRTLIAAGANIAAPALPGGQTALAIAARRGGGDVVPLLLEAGAGDRDTEREDGATPLLHALIRADLKTARTLHAAGLGLGRAAATEPTQYLPALASVLESEDNAFLRLLIQAGTPVGEARIDGMSALGIAAAKGNQEGVQILVEAGTPVDDMDQTGQTPLMYAAANGHQAIARHLIAAGADSGRHSRGGKLPETLAADASHPSLANWLMVHRLGLAPDVGLAAILDRKVALAFWDGRTIRCQITRASQQSLSIVEKRLGVEMTREIPLAKIQKIAILDRQ